MNSVVEGIRFLWAWMESWFPWKKKEKPTGPQVERYVLNDYKKFADERQKAKRNRRRKPKKAMKRLYQLGRNKAHPRARRS